MAAIINLVDSDSESDVEYVCETAESKNENDTNKNDEERTFYAKRSKHDKVVAAWQLCELLESKKILGKTEHIVQYKSDNARKLVPEHELASIKIPAAHQRIVTGTRIVSKRSSGNLQYTTDKNDCELRLLSSDGDFYPAIIVVTKLENRFLVFCDDGLVQLVGRESIRLVKGNDTRENAHWNARPHYNFFENDSGKNYDRLNIGQTIKVKLNGVYESAIVTRVDACVAQIRFINAQRFEWIHMGSSHVFEIYHKLVKNSGLDNLIKFRKYMPSQTANTDIVLVETAVSEPLAVPQNALEVRAPNAVASAKNSPALRGDINIESVDAFQRPMLMGWSRKGNDNIFYRAPCESSSGSRYFHTLKEIDDYLAESGSELRIDCFDLSRIHVPEPSMNTLARELENIDISNGKEKIPISVDGQMNRYNSFNYITSYNFDLISVEKQNDLGRKGCSCTDNCRDKSKCSCWQLTVQRELNKVDDSIHSYKQHERIGYKHMRLERIVSSGIVECSGNCKCCADRCVNRVAQIGLQHSLEVFKTENKGWGVRTKNDLSSGIFITMYIGIILTSTLAEESDTKYQFQLPTINQTQQSEDDGAESDIGRSESSDSSESTSDDFEIVSDSDDEPKMKRPRSHDVVQPFVNCFPLRMRGGNADHFKESGSGESHENADTSYVIDSRNHGNFSRFLNHSCEPNLFAQLIYVDNDKRFPNIAFFTKGEIKAGTELTINYGYELTDGRETRCLCGSSKCRKRLT